MKILKYILLMFVVICVTYSQSKHTEHPILFTTSVDGISWSNDPIKLIDNGISPTAVYAGGKIYLYYISDSLSLIRSNDNGITFKHFNVSIARKSNGVLKDPNVIVSDDLFKMFFITSDKDINTLRCALSFDGLNFTEETSVLYQEKGVFKPDAGLINNLWIIFLTLGGDIIKITSSDGTTFIKDNDFFYPSALYSATINENTFLRTYYTADYSINSFKSINNKTTKEGELFRDHNIFISEPSVIKTTSTYFMFYKKTLPNDFIDTCGCEKKLNVEW